MYLKVGSVIVKLVDDRNPIHVNNDEHFILFYNCLLQGYCITSKIFIHGAMHDCFITFECSNETHIKVTWEHVPFF